MNRKIKIKAYAKINLALAILGCEHNMHIIDSIVTNVELSDKIVITKRKDNKIVVKYKNIDAPSGDTAKKMAELLQKTYKTNGMNINITKKIPIASGLGGSSADAAGVARGIQRLFNLETIPARILQSVGSDVPYMYIGGDKRIKGAGEIIEDIVLPKARYVILECQGGVSTAKAYKLYDEIGGDSPDIDAILMKMNSGKPFELSNSLQRAAEELNPNIKKSMQLLNMAGFTKSVMSGSGSCCIAVESDEKKYNRCIKKLKKLLPAGYKLYKS